MATATAQQNWLGFSANFENVEDRTSENNFELLPEGFYKAHIKNVVKSVLGENNKPALTITLELEDSKKEMVHNLFLPQNGDEQSAIDFKLQNLRNFFTRCLYSKLTKEEYNALDAKEKNDALTKMQTSSKGPAQFVDSKVLVHIKQEPFIAQDKETKAIKFTEKPTAYLINAMPKSILKLINEKEQNGIDMSKMPVVLFSNKITACGFGFYNDFDPDVVLKNSKAYDFIQANLDTSSTATTETTQETKKIPSF